MGSLSRAWYHTFVAAVFIWGLAWHPDTVVEITMWVLATGLLAQPKDAISFGFGYKGNLRPLIEMTLPSVF